MTEDYRIHWSVVLFFLSHALFPEYCYYHALLYMEESSRSQEIHGIVFGMLV